MKGALIVPLLFSCIMCVQVNRLASTFGWGNNPFGYPNLRTSVVPLPLQLQLNAMAPNASTTQIDVMNAVMQISRGSEKFSFEFFRVCISMGNLFCSNYLNKSVLCCMGK